MSKLSLKERHNPSMSKKKRQCKGSPEYFWRKAKQKLHYQANGATAETKENNIPRDFISNHLPNRRYNKFMGWTAASRFSLKISRCASAVGTLCVLFVVDHKQLRNELGLLGSFI